MKKIALIILFVAGLVFSGQAQQADSTATETKKPAQAKPEEQKPAKPAEEEKPSTTVQKKDSIPTSTTPAPTAVPSTLDQPRIIYYQDSRPEYQNKKDDIKTLSGSMSHSGGFFGFSFRASEFKDETAVLAGFRTGWIINRTLGIGFEGHGIIPTAKFDDIDPNFNTVLLGGYGGMFMEFVVFSNQVVHVTFPVAGGAGWLGYHEDWENERINNPNVNSQGGIIDQDVFWYLEPGASIEMNISRSFRMALGLSKRITDDFELVNTESRDFENINFFLTLKLGKF